jgi:transcriptional regulator with XRE-family HTH domain
METIQKKILQNIFSIRKQIGLSQENIADVLQISAASYSKFESGNVEITVDRLAKIADCFSMSLIDVITYPQKYSLSTNNTKKTRILVELELEEQELSIQGIKNKILKL